MSKNWKKILFGIAAKTDEAIGFLLWFSVTGPDYTNSGVQVSVYAVHVEWMQLWNLFVLNLEHMFINYYFLQSVTTIYINKAQSSSEMFSTGY